ncbi:hypothetical protein [Levilactobacillus yonginensis]
MLNHKGLIKFVTMLGIGVSLLGVGSVTANASSKPYVGSFPSRKITYHIDSTSKHWKNIWQGAINSWNSLHVVKLRATKKASKADIRLKTKKNVEGHHLIGGELGGPGGRGGLFFANLALNRKLMSDVHDSEKNKEMNALATVGQAIGLAGTNDHTSALSSFASKPSAKDKANLKLAYKGIK